MSKPTEQEPICAAGGLLVRTAGNEPSIAIVHRGRYGDRSLPKGKLQPGESWESAALREVYEETGYRARIVGFAGPVLYHVGDGHKLVLFWHMVPEGQSRFHPSEEVESVEWLTFDRACDRLDYPEQKRLLQDFVRRWPGEQ